jgi:phenylalanyl-tRNA synthetase beta chain
MLVSYKWLNEFVDLDGVTPNELADKMSVTGIEVEGVTVPEMGLKNLVVGEVVECVDHPDSDHLHICQVNVGAEELSQIICGAPNIKAGVKVIVALPGARIKDNVKIKKGKMRGQVSNGMICSLQEIGFNESVVPKEYADGIYYLPAEAIPGESIFPYLDMDDSIIELSITPNRADALSMRGVAYEVGAIYNQTPTFHDEELIEGDTLASEKITVTVEEKELVPAYQIRIIEDVKIAPSPTWLQKRLMNEGIRPINNVVDVTNYILLLFGQPLHAFDYHRIGSKEIVVRRAHEAEELVTLDGETRRLRSEELVITNGAQPIALAGVMGGLDSEIVSDTTTVALEAAMFHPISIRRTANYFNLRSESSARFEKGINQATIGQACDVAAAMIAKLAGGTVLKEAVVATQTNPKDVKVPITLSRINQYLGTALSLAGVGGIFDALGFAYELTDEEFTVIVPPRRWDIQIEADIIEEVARIYGYDRLPSTLPSGETVAGTLTRSQRLTRRIREVVEGTGFSEAISYALTTEKKSTQFVMKESQLTRLDWPMTEDRAVLRMNLISGLLDDLAYNIARKNQSLAFYEIGRVFYQDGDAKKDLPTEQNHIAFALTGEVKSKDWQTKSTPADFYLLKGVLETVFDRLSILDRIQYIATSAISELHPGRTADIYIDHERIGFIGQVHPTIAKEYDITETYVAELNLEALTSTAVAEVRYQPVSKFPNVNRDIAMLVKEEVSNQEVIDTIKEVSGRFLIQVKLFDVYQGASIDKGMKSLAYSLTFSNPEMTLTDEEITNSMNKIEKNLIEKLGAVIR